MAELIRIDDLAAPVLNDVQRMGIEYGESKATELSVDAVCAAAADPDGARRLRPGRLHRTPRPAARRDGRRRRSDRPGPPHDVRRLRPLRIQPPLGARPAAPSPRDPRHPDRAPADRGRAAAFGHHPPREPVGRRHPVPLHAAVGVLRTGGPPRGGVDAGTTGWTLDGRAATTRGKPCRRRRRWWRPCTRWHRTTCTRRSSCSCRTSRATTSSGWPGRRSGATTTAPTTRRRTTPT